MKKLTPELLSKFLHLDCQLSPENLTCDGELSDADVQRRRKVLMAQWKELEIMAGRTVTPNELYLAEFDAEVEGELTGRKMMDAQDVRKEMATEDEMDGDAESALTSAGRGLNESYGFIEDRL